MQLSRFFFKFTPTNTLFPHSPRFEINNWFAHLTIFWHNKIRLTCSPWKIKPGYDFESADGSGSELGSSSRHPSDIEPRNWSSEVLKQSVIEGVTPAVMADYLSFVGSCRVLKLFVLLFVLTRLPYLSYQRFRCEFQWKFKNRIGSYTISNIIPKSSSLKSMICNVCPFENVRNLRKFVKGIYLRVTCWIVTQKSVISTRSDQWTTSMYINADFESSDPLSILKTAQKQHCILYILVKWVLHPQF